MDKDVNQKLLKQIVSSLTLDELILKIQTLVTKNEISFQKNIDSDIFRTGKYDEVIQKIINQKLIDDNFEIKEDNFVETIEIIKKFNLLTDNYKLPQEINNSSLFTNKKLVEIIINLKNKNFGDFITFLKSLPKTRYNPNKLLFDILNNLFGFLTEEELIKLKKELNLEEKKVFNRADLFQYRSFEEVLKEFYDTKSFSDLNFLIDEIEGWLGYEYPENTKFKKQLQKNEIVESDYQKIILTFENNLDKIISKLEETKGNFKENLFFQKDAKDKLAEAYKRYLNKTGFTAKGLEILKKLKQDINVTEENILVSSI